NPSDLDHSRRLSQHKPQGFLSWLNHHTASFTAKLLRAKSGTRDSNPRLRPWQIDVRLKIRASRLTVSIPNHPKPNESRRQFRPTLNAAEMRQKRLWAGTQTILLFPSQ